MAFQSHFLNTRLILLQGKILSCEDSTCSWSHGQAIFQITSRNCRRKVLTAKHTWNKDNFWNLLTTIFDTLQSISKVFFFPLSFIADLLIMSLLYRAPKTWGSWCHSIWGNFGTDVCTLLKKFTLLYDYMKEKFPTFLMWYSIVTEYTIQ